MTTKEHPPARIPPGATKRCSGWSWRYLAMMVVMVLLVGCTSTGRRTAIPLTAGLEGPMHATLEVYNGHSHEIEVLVMRTDGRTPQRVGDVGARSQRGFRLPRPLNYEPVQVVLRCRVEREVHETSEVVWRPTDVVGVSVGPYLPLTKVEIR